MFGSPIIETAIGIMFIFLILSLINSALSEFFAGVAGLRAKHLKLGVENLVGRAAEGGLADEVMKHPLIASLIRKRGKTGKLPSYISSETFARALTDVLYAANLAKRLPTADDLRDGVSGLKDEDLRRTLLLFINEADNDITKFKTAVEQWFNDTMDRVSGWYKRTAHWVAVFFAFTITISLNADTIAIARTLYRNPTIRMSVANAAGAFVSDSMNIAAVQRAARRAPSVAPGDTTGPVQPDAAAPDSVIMASLAEIRRLTGELRQTALPIGWSRDVLPSAPGSWIAKIIGLLFTGVATALGAPFWFQVLNKIVNLRGAGRQPPAKQPISAQAA